MQFSKLCNFSHATLLLSLSLCARGTAKFAILVSVVIIGYLCTNKLFTFHKTFQTNLAV